MEGKEIAFDQSHTSAIAPNRARRERKRQKASCVSATGSEAAAGRNGFRETDLSEEANGDAAGGTVGGSPRPGSGDGA